MKYPVLTELIEVRSLLSQRPDHPSTLLVEWIRTEFQLPVSIMQHCEESFLRVWNGKYVADTIEDGILQFANQSWMVHWQSTPAIVRTVAQVGCSFRKYKGRNFVVIKVWKSDKEQNSANKELGT